MLVVSRKEGETIRIPSLGIEIQVKGVKKSRVVLGIDAPSNIRVLRGEIDSPEGCIPADLGQVAGSANMKMGA